MRLERTLAVLARVHDTAIGIAKVAVTALMILSVLVFSGETDKMWIPCAGVAVFGFCVWAANRLWKDNDNEI